jgi:arsenical pump membrane protein
VLVTGLLPRSAAADVVERVWPILLFLVAVTVVAELADLAGVFDVAAREAAALARGRVLGVWLLLVVLACGTTIVLSLDTTAVLLTPVVLVVADQLGLPALPFAMTTVWLANTASLLLPVSNLTNLLAVDRLGASTWDYVSAVWPAALSAILVTVAALWLMNRTALSGRYEVPPPPAVPDKPSFVVAAAVCLALAVLFLLDVAYWLAATAAAVLLLATFLARRRADLRWSLVPWQLVVTVLGLFLVVEAVARHGGADALRHLVGSGDDIAGLLQVAGVAAVASNLVNNLPAYLVIEPEAAQSTYRLLALLVGTNVGSIVTLWGSLATLLWRERCRARGLEVSWTRFAWTGALTVGLAVPAAVVSLALSG